MDISNISNLLRRLQQDGMTQSEIADAIGCSQPTVSEMTTGKIGKKRPAYKLVTGIVQLAKKRGIKLTEITGERRSARDDRRKGPRRTTDSPR
jgi:predicted XRE-type DNA-binding protein